MTMAPSKALPKLPEGSLVAAQPGQENLSGPPAGPVPLVSFREKPDSATAEAMLALEATAKVAEYQDEYQQGAAFLGALTPDQLGDAGTVEVLRKVKTLHLPGNRKVVLKTIRVPEQEVRQRYIDQVPMKRGCTYDDVANLVIFLASDQSSYMTGQAINVTGGQEMR